MSVLDHASVARAELGHPPHAASAARAPWTLRAAQVLSVLMALPMTLGSFFFAVIAPDHHYAAWVTWALAPIAFATGVGLLATAPRLARSPRHTRLTMLRLLGAAEAFSVIKLSVFHEGASVPFLALGLIVIGLLCSQSVRAYVAGSRHAGRR